jgi:hypothetical protein
MPHTLQTAIAFPVVFAGIVALISYGPVLYKETVDAALFEASSIELSIQNETIYALKPLSLGGESYDIICTSPERMHVMIRALQDSGSILSEGVFSP